MAGFFRALAGSRQGSAAADNKVVLADLKRITHSSAVDVPADALASVTKASSNEDDRRQIMMHLRECLAEASGKQWRRVYGGLLLLEALVKNGSPELMAETAEGHHFDLVQRLSFLEHYAMSDKMGQGMVRTKAAALRKDVIPLLEGAALKDKQVASDVAMETASTCSPGSVASSTGFGSDDVSTVMAKLDGSHAPKRMTLNNIVTVGHSDDTTSESECDDGNIHAARFGKSQRMSARARNERRSQAKGHTSDAAQEPTKVTTAEQMPTQPVDLLDF